MDNRRTFLKNTGRTALSSLCIGGSLALYGNYLKKAPRPHLPDGEPAVLRPPGALTEKEFLATCIRCQRCKDTCPVDAIQLAGPNDPAEPFTPFLLSAEHACILCLKCTEACPTGALRLVEKKEKVRMGTAVVNELTCVSHNGTGVCGACHTACPLRNDALVQGLRNAPTINPDTCVGCGLCEEACIIKGVKAIRVFSGREAS